MRIIGGVAKGRKLKSFKGMDIRPTYDRVRETLFNVLGSKVEDSSFLDLFGGTGNVGLEALSRGARWVVFVDSSLKAVNLIQANLSICSFPQNRSLILHQNVFGALADLSGSRMKFDLIFADPPFLTELAAQTVERIGHLDILEPGGLVVIQHDVRDSLEEAYGILHLGQKKKIGDAVLSFFGGKTP